LPELLLHCAFSRHVLSLPLDALSFQRVDDPLLCSQLAVPMCHRLGHEGELPCQVRLLATPPQLPGMLCRQRRMCFTISSLRCLSTLSCRSSDRVGCNKAVLQLQKPAHTAQLRCGKTRLARAQRLTTRGKLLHTCRQLFTQRIHLLAGCFELVREAVTFTAMFPI